MNLPRAGKKGSKNNNKSPSKQPSGYSTPARPVDQLDADMIALNLKGPSSSAPAVEPEEPPKVSLSREKLLEEARKAVSGQAGIKPNVSIVVIGNISCFLWLLTLLTCEIGHVDAGKSTLMGRLLYELGKIEQKRRTQNERSSEKVGKSSFSWAWEMDSGEEERNRLVADPDYSWPISTCF
jgi:elongation factor 1 alpha-like protein